mmetsp:Transcript_58475/g.137321  ORF Transcript_58475/g.137321 Transcript_58475/m.137321 type:complete len:112 (+) Transcript_58475:841-1176(+)
MRCVCLLFLCVSKHIVDALALWPVLFFVSSSSFTPLFFAKRLPSSLHSAHPSSVPLSKPCVAIPRLQFLSERLLSLRSVTWKALSWGQRYDPEPITFATHLLRLGYGVTRE